MRVGASREGTEGTRGGSRRSERSGQALSARSFVFCGLNSRRNRAGFISLTEVSTVRAGRTLELRRHIESGRCSRQVWVGTQMKSCPPGATGGPRRLGLPVMQRDLTPLCEGCVLQNASTASDSAETGSLDGGKDCATSRFSYQVTLTPLDSLSCRLILSSCIFFRLVFLTFFRLAVCRCCDLLLLTRVVSPKEGVEAVRLNRERTRASQKKKKERKRKKKGCPHSAGTHPLSETQPVLNLLRASLARLGSRFRIPHSPGGGPRIKASGILRASSVKVCVCHNHISNREGDSARRLRTGQRGTLRPRRCPDRRDGRAPCRQSCLPSGCTP